VITFLCFSCPDAPCWVWTADGRETCLTWTAGRIFLRDARLAFPTPGPSTGSGDDRRFRHHLVLRSALRAHTCIRRFRFSNLHRASSLTSGLSWVQTIFRSGRTPPPPQLNVEPFLSTSVFEGIADACAPITLVRAHRWIILVPSFPGREIQRTVVRWYFSYGLISLSLEFEFSYNTLSIKRGTPPSTPHPPPWTPHPLFNTFTNALWEQKKW